MPFAFHANRSRYFDIQRQATADSVIPFIERARPLRAGDRVLEIGSAEGGVLAAFLERDCKVTGIELSAARTERARQFLAEAIDQGAAQIFTSDIYDLVDDPKFHSAFDVIVMKDVIEHIHDQGRLLGALHRFLAPGGVLFLGFPPWQMPFGGHQQVLDNRVLALVPYTHLLPAPAYAALMRAGGEKDQKVRAMLEIKETGLSIEQLEGIVRDTGWSIRERRFFLVAPIYRHKFGLPTVRQSGLVSRLPVVRNFMTTQAYYALTSLAASG